MALIVMAVYDTAQNQRTEYTNRTLVSLLESVDLNKHRLIISDNGSCEETHELYFHLLNAHSKLNIEIIYNNENIGTARAMNKGILKRNPGEHIIKIDNDVVIIDNTTWVDDMEFIVESDKRIGVLGLKRKDLIESPFHNDPNWRSTLRMINHKLGDNWYIIEEAKHIMGTCCMYTSLLIDKVGLLWQPGLYGYDDSLMCTRSAMAGFKNAFLPSIKIDHIDDGLNGHTQEKVVAANDMWDRFQEVSQGFVSGKYDIFIGKNYKLKQNGNF
jgi:GT2 family glycosyltransferase